MEAGSLDPLGKRMDVGLRAFVVVAILSASTIGQERPMASDPLDLVPAKTDLVVQVRGLERVQDRIEKLFRTAMPDRADEAVANLRRAVADGLDGRDQKSLKPDGRIVAAIGDLDKLPDGGTIVLIIPARTLDDFKTGFLTAAERKSLKKDGDLETVRIEDREAPFWLLPVGSDVVLASSKELAQQYAKGTVAGLRGRVSADTARTFREADVSLLVNVPEITAKYGERLRQLKSLADVFLKGGTVQGVSKSQLEQIRAAWDALFQVIDDGVAVAVGLDFHPDGLALRGTAEFKAGSTAADLLARQSPSALPALQSLPVGLPSYTASQLNLTDARFRSLASSGFAAEDSDAKAGPAIAGLLRDLAALDRGVTVSGGQVMTLLGLEAIASKEADKIVATRLKVLQTLTKSGSFANVPLREKPQVVEAAQKVGGVTFHETRLAFDFDRAVADLPASARDATRASLKRTIGGTDLRLWLGSDGKTAYQFAGKSWDDVKPAAEANFARTGLVGDEPAFHATRKRLPATATAITLVDAARAASSFLDAIQSPAIGPGGREAGKPAYVGVALVLRARHGDVEVFVPATAVAALRRLFEPILKDEK